MNDVHSEIRDLVRRACEGDRDALGVLLERHRAYLKILTQRYLNRQLEARFDASDVVQQTCVSVIRDFKRFAGSSEAEFLAWLRKIHERNVQDANRDHAMAEKRAVGREQVGSGVAQDLPETGEASPSQRAMHGEDAVRLAGTMERLPADQCEAVRLRHLEGRSLAEIAHHMGRSEDAAAGLIKRGLRSLRDYLKDDGKG